MIRLLDTSVPLVTPPLPPLFLCISLQDPTVVVKVALILPTLPSRLQLRLCVAPRFNSRHAFHIWALDVCGRIHQVENVRRACSGECLSAGVSDFKPGHGFIISSLTLEFEYLVGNRPQTKTSVWGCPEPNVSSQIETWFDMFCDKDYQVRHACALVSRVGLVTTVPRRRWTTQFSASRHV